jgi:integrase
LKLLPTPANRRYAANLKAEIENHVARGTFNYADFFPDSRRARILSKRKGDVVNLREALRRYIDSSEKALQRSTWLDYKGTVETHLIPAFGELRLTELTRARMREWAAKLTVTPKRLANILLPLRAVLADAVEDEVLSIGV